MVTTFSLDKGGGLVGGGGLSLGMEFRGLSLGMGVRGGLSLGVGVRGRLSLGVGVRGVRGVSVDVEVK